MRDVLKRLDALENAPTQPYTVVTFEDGTQKRMEVPDAYLATIRGMCDECDEQRIISCDLPEGHLLWALVNSVDDSAYQARLKIIEGDYNEQ